VDDEAARVAAGCCCGGAPARRAPADVEITAKTAVHQRSQR